MSEEPLSTRSRMIFGLVGGGVIAAGAVFVAVGTQPSYSGSTYYTADFGRAGQGLDPGKSDVKIRGIAVGAVDRVSLEKSGRVSVRFRIDEGVRLPTTSSARIEPLSIFGPKDLSLDLGANEASGPYLRDGGRVDKTQDPQELSETAWPTYRLTRAIDPDEVTTILRTFAAGLDGQGPALRRTIDNGSKVIDAAHANRRIIAQLISDLNGLSGSLASRGDTWTAFTRDFNQLAPVVHQRPDKVQALLGESAELAERVGTTMRGHGANLGSVIDGSGEVTAVLAGERRNIPVLLDSLNGFFEVLSSIIRVPGPKGTLLGQVLEPLPLDLCQLIVDICGPAPRANARDTGTGRR
ncbi:MCE family protein [Spirillospora sp. CA-294931]|uniref:MCE family protein n=1 Tax=Spirillospora sp. CA-294931 TaxID=3240042 RepID=UPI003D91D703